MEGLFGVKTLLDTTLYFLAIINPISKVFVLSLLSEKAVPRELHRISLHASGVALAILLVFAAAGTYLLTGIFRVEIHSLSIAGGAVLVTMGFRALNRGVFFETDVNQRLAEISIVPLASPMIAGPATITAVVHTSTAESLPLAATAILLAVLANLGIMLLSRRIGVFLLRHNIMGALIRITGLVVMTIGVQMVLGGVSEWIGKLPCLGSP